MDATTFIINFLVVSTTCVFCRRDEIKENTPCRRWDRNGDSPCLQNGTKYIKWSCDTKDDPHNRVWIKDKTVTCETGYRCRCIKHWWTERQCECYNTKIFPSFPKTGIVRWNGTHFWDDHWWVNRENERSVRIQGELHRDSIGRFLHKWSTVGKWEPLTQKLPDIKTEFEIIIPNGDGTFIRYSGNDDSKSCKKKTTTNRGSLNSIYKKISINGRTFTMYKSQTRSETMTTETWELDDKFEDGLWKWTWIVDYEARQDLAYPVRFVHRREDGFGGELKEITLDYTYEPIKEHGDETFRLENYCDGI